MDFQSRLQRLRKDRNLSQIQLAEILNVSRQTLSKWETGAAMPDTTNLIILSQIFHVSTDYLLGISESKSCNATDTRESGSPSIKSAKYAGFKRISMIVLVLCSICLLVQGILHLYWPNGPVYSVLTPTPEEVANFVYAPTGITAIFVKIYDANWTIPFSFFFCIISVCVLQLISANNKKL